MLFDDPEEEFMDEEPSYPSMPEEGGLPQPRFAEKVHGFDSIEKTLLDLSQSGRMPHAMIFAGLQGIGKSTMAFRFAKFLLSKKEDSGTSLFGDAPSASSSLASNPEDQSTRLILSGGHPDLMVIERKFEEDKGKYKDIDVEQAREIPSFLRLTPFMGGWRIVIVDDADTMTRAAQNAILKTLEEPPANALIILIAHRPGMLIPTIRSRCRMIEFPTPDRNDFEALVKQAMPGTSPQDIVALYNISGGSVGTSLRLMQEGALKSLHQFTSLVESWPDLNWTQIHLMGELLNSKGQDAALQGFQEILLWSCEQLTRARAKGGLDALPAPLNSGPFPKMLGHYSLEQWSRICDDLKIHLATVKYGSLDRRQAVFGAFSILQGKA